MSYISKNNSDEKRSAWSKVLCVASMDVYRRDCVVKYTWSGGRPVAEGSNKKEITELSKDSLSRLAFVANNTSVDFTWMMTLTYPNEFPMDGITVKAHLNAMLSWMRYREKGFAYLWFMEFQKRGAPHLHLLMDRPFDRLDVSERWYKLVGSGDEKHLFAGTRVEKLRSKRGGANYVTKYASKCQQKAVPLGFRNVGRFWGHSRNVKPEPIASAEIGATKDQFTQALSFWDYQQSLVAAPLKVLYNLSEQPEIAGLARNGENKDDDGNERQ